MKCISSLYLMLIFLIYISYVTSILELSRKTHKNKKQIWKNVKNFSSKVFKDSKNKVEELKNSKLLEDVKIKADELKKFLGDKIKTVKEPIWYSNNTPQNLNFDITKRIKEFSTPLALYFEKIAGFAYCNHSSVINNKCCDNWVSKEGWIRDVAEEFPDGYNYSILKNYKFQKIIIALPGTRSNKQLFSEFVNSRLVNFEGEPSLKAVKYFYDLYEKVKSSVFTHLKNLYAKYPDYQYIFVGHSLGGAMSTLLSVGSVINGKIKQNKDSPVLITFGSPRVGNDILANTVMEKVPIVFRIVRQGDVVASIPNCSSIPALNVLCSTVLKKFIFVKGLFSKLIRNKKASTGNANTENEKLIYGKYAFHVGGLKLFDMNMKKYNECGNNYGDNNPDKSCRLSPTLNVDYHTFYFGQNTRTKISEICKSKK